MGFYFLD